MTLANTFHFRTDGPPACLAVVFSHKLTGQSLDTIENSFLNRFLGTVGPFSGELVTEVYVLKGDLTFTIEFEVRWFDVMSVCFSSIDL